MGERVVSGNFCDLGIRVIFSKVLSGEWPLEELYQSNRCFCNCGREHNWLCLHRFHQKYFRIIPNDIAIFVKANFTRLKARPNLVNELQRVRGSATVDCMWVFTMYPIIKDMPQFQPHIQMVAANAGSHTYTKALAEIGVAKRMPMDPSGGYDNDLLLYFSMMRPRVDRPRIKVSFGFGPYSIQFLRILWMVCHVRHNLPVELVLVLFNLIYHCNVSSRHFDRIFLDPVFNSR